MSAKALVECVSGVWPGEGTHEPGSPEVQHVLSGACYGKGGAARNHHRHLNIFVVASRARVQSERLAEIPC